MGEILSKRIDGSTFWEYVTITPIKNAEDKITNFVGIKENITQRKIMEQELIEALDKAERSDKLKDAFLQNLSHEIRTPLNAIVGFSELLSVGSEQHYDKITEYSSIIVESSFQLLAIVSDILTIASIQTGQETIMTKNVNLDKLVDHLYEVYLPMANKNKLVFSISKPIAEHPIIIRTDETKLNQILTNLLNNAFKFTHHGSVELKYRLQGSNIDFLVIDTGIGIPEEFQAIIFERFRQASQSIQTNYGGTGLGLSISSAFAQMLGGILRVESEPDKGSTFVLSLPYSPVEDISPQQPQSFISLANKTLTILVVEDEITNYLLIKEYLELPDAKILYAENGYLALKTCEENPQIDLVLMDIKMPVMDGIQAFREIRKLWPDLPVIAQTAYALEKEKQELLDIGFNDYIVKPIDRGRLLSVINIYSGSNS
jgi:signal transduction histidine kinase